MIFSINRFIFNLLLLGTLLTVNLAAAQSLAPAPLITSRDEVGVDVISGDPLFTLPDLSIGTGVSSLPHTISNGGWPYFWGFNDDYDVYVVGAGTFGTSRLAVLGHTSQLFDKVTVGYAAHNGDGSTLTLERININVNGTDTMRYTYLRKDGVKFTYDYLVQTNTGTQVQGATSSVVTYPNGYEVTVLRDAQWRKQSVLTNTGLQLKYINDRVNDAPANEKAAPSVSKIVAINQAYEYCNPMAVSCVLTNTWPAVTYTWPKYSDIYFPKNTSYIQAKAVEGKFKVTDAEDRVTIYYYSPQYYTYANGDTYWSPRIVAVKERTAPTTAANITYSYDNYIHCYVNASDTWECDVLKWNVVSYAYKAGAKWSYNYDQPYTQFVITGSSTGPKGTHSTVMTVDGDSTLAATGINSYLSYVSTVNDESAYFTANEANLAMSATVRGRGVKYKYDSRNNIVQETQGEKITTAEYQPCTTANFKWCNKATAIIDAKLNRTDYTYYDEHGQIKSLTLPSADGSSVRPQTRYKYTQLYAWYKNSANVMTRETRPVWLLTEENTCSQGAATEDGCADPTKLVTTRYNYGPDSGPNNLWLRGVEKIADGKTLRTCYQYDMYGHVIAETEPKAGLASCQ